MLSGHEARRGGEEIVSEKITLIYDTELKRPGCVLLQAVAGCDQYALNRFFNSEDWLVSPTPGMKRISGTPEEWKRAAKMCPKKPGQEKGS